MLSLSGPKALLFLPLLIAFINRSAVNVHAIPNGFLLVSLVTTRVSLEEVCLSSFEVLNCWLNLVASCLDDENEIPLKVIASLSASRFALRSVPLIVLHSLVRSVFWSMVSTKSLHFFVCAHRYGSGCLYSILAVQMGWALFYGGHLVQYLCWYRFLMESATSIRAFFGSLLENNDCSGRPLLSVCIYHSWPSLG